MNIKVPVMKICRRLEEYAIFVPRVRLYRAKGESQRQAIDHAIEECINGGVLVDILTKQRSEVMEVVLSTFNKELYEKNLKADAYEEGKEDGIHEGGRLKLKELVKRKLAKGKSAEEIAEALEEDLTLIKELIEEITRE